MNNHKPNGSNTYREQQILTASPARLVAMLYEKAITCLRQAIKAIEEGDIKKRWASNARAVEIIEHLSMTLDTETGGEFASELERLYPFMIGHLINVDVHNDPEPAREIIALLEPLNEAWLALDRQMARGAPMAEPAHPEASSATTDPEAPTIEPLPGGRLRATA